MGLGLVKVFLPTGEGTLEPVDSVDVERATGWCGRQQEAHLDMLNTPTWRR